MRAPFITMIVSSAVATSLVLGFASCSADKEGGIKAAATGKKTEEDTSTSDDELSDLGSDDGGDDSSQDLDAILKDCGVDKETLADPDAVLLDKELTAWPKVFVGTANAPIIGAINYRVQVYTKLKIHATLKEMTQTISFDVKTEPSGGMAGDTIKTEASAKTEPNRGTTTAQVLGTDKRPDLMSSSPDWNGVLCTVQPVTEMKVVKGGKGKLIRFDPPLPGSVSPKANAKRYDAEIGQGHTWNNIVATIAASGDPALPVDSKVTGSVSITPADPNLTLQISQSGGTKTFSASRAFTIRFDFGGVEKTLAMGLNPMQTMYIDDETHDVKIVVVDTGVAETGVIVLSDSGGP